MSQWYFARGGQQNGPVSFSELKTLATSGQLDAQRDLAWCDGMTDWKPAGEIENLFPRSAAMAANPYAPPSSSDSLFVDTVATFPSVRRTNYALMAGLTIAGILLIIAGYVPLMAQAFTATTSGGITNSSAAIAGIVVFAGLGLLIAGSIMGLMYLYRAWQLLQPNTTVSTPGRAVGFLFIPFYNLYWQFIAYWKWSQEWNRLVADRPEHSSAPRQSEGLFLAYAILVAAGLLLGALAIIPQIVLYLIAMKGLCNAVNYAADRTQGRP